MAMLSFPSSPINGQQYTDSNSVVWQYNSSKGVWNKLRSDVEKQFSGAKVKLSNVLILSDTLSSINFEFAEYDTGTYFTLSSPTRLTAAFSGFYRIAMLINTGTQGNGASYTFSVYKNGSVLNTTTAGPNQAVEYDETVLLNAGDYIEFKASESGNVGTLLITSFWELQRIGFNIGSSFSLDSAFSGVRLELTTAENMTTTPTAISWDNANDFNLNADINGNVYWNIGSSGKVNIYTTGYYRAKSVCYSSAQGSDDSYKVDLRKDGTTLTSASFGPNDITELDETYRFLSGSYLEVFASNSGNVGTLTTDSYFELIRLGV